MILSIIAATAAAGVIYTCENAAQRGITRVINNRKAEKAGYVSAAAYPTPAIPQQPMIPQQPIPMMPPPFIQQAAAEVAATQQAVQAPAPDPTPAPAPAADAAQAPAVAAVIAELTAAAKEIAAAAAQVPAPAPESGNPYKLGSKVHLVIDPDANGVRRDLNDVEVPAGINDGTINKIIDDNIVVVAVPETSAKNAPRKKLTLLIDDVCLV